MFRSCDSCIITVDRQRTSDTQFNGITFHINDYPELTDWSGRAIRDDKTGAIPAHLAPTLQRLGLDRRF
jgi:hypothetical protein